MLDAPAAANEKAETEKKQSEILAPVTKTLFPPPTTMRLFSSGECVWEYQYIRGLIVADNAQTSPRYG